MEVVSTQQSEVLPEDFCCPICDAPLDPIVDNTGFNELGAEHFEIVGYECISKGCVYSERF